MLAGHTLADDLGVLVNENMGARLVSVGEGTGGERCHGHRPLEHTSCKSLAKHFFYLFNYILL